jgi:hypothetical protein
MGAHAQPRLDVLAPPAARLGGAVRRHTNAVMAGSLSQGLAAVQERAPTRVVQAVREPVVVEHPADVPVGDPDAAVPRRSGVRRREGEATARAMARAMGLRHDRPPAASARNTVRPASSPRTGCSYAPRSGGPIPGASCGAVAQTTRAYPCPSARKTRGAVTGVPRRGRCSGLVSRRPNCAGPGSWLPVSSSPRPGAPRPDVTGCAASESGS